MDFKYAIFDMDGTLIDSMDLWDKLERKVVGQELGVDLENGEHSNFIYAGLSDMISKANKVSSKQVTVDYILPKLYAIMDNNYSNGSIKTIDGAVEYLKYLKSKSVKIAIATATRYESCKKCLQDNGILPLIDAFVSTDDVKKSKLHPDVYLKAIEMLGGSKDESVVFEDTLRCLNTLYQNGFKYVIVHDKVRSEIITDELKKNALRYIYSYKELMDNE